MSLGFVKSFDFSFGKRKELNKKYIPLPLKDNVYNEIDRNIDFSSTGSIIWQKILSMYDAKWEQEIKELPFLKKIYMDFLKYGSFAIHVSYDSLLEIKKISYANIKNYRVYKKDDLDNVVEYHNISTKANIWAFNDDKQILESQVKNNIENFIGQIYIYNPSNMDYNLSPIVSCLDAMKLQAFYSKNKINLTKAALKKNNVVFYNTEILGSIEYDIDNKPQRSKDTRPILDFADRVEKLTAGETLFQGVFLFHGQTFEDLIKVVDLTNTSAQSIVTEKDLQESYKLICQSFYGYPVILLNTESSFFGSSGEAINAAAKIFRTELYALFENVMKDIAKDFNLVYSPIKEIEPNEEQKTIEETQKTDENVNY